ncbi:MAG: TlpA disulfide reductase family protein [Candidatus Cybelea sp.]
MHRYIIWPAVALALAIAVYVAEPYFVTQRAASGGPSGLSGQRAPIFNLRDDRGRAASLEQYRGSLVVMNLWASWCPPCRAEMPDLERLAEAEAGRRIAVIGVNEGESPQQARAFAASLGIRFPIWVDGRQQYGRAYNALGLPTTVILDPQGVVIRAFDGPLTLDQMRAAVAAVRAP